MASEEETFSSNTPSLTSQNNQAAPETEGAPNVGSNVDGGHPMVEDGEANRIDDEPTKLSVPADETSGRPAGLAGLCEEVDPASSPNSRSESDSPPASTSDKEALDPGVATKLGATNWGDGQRESCFPAKQEPEAQEVVPVDPLPRRPVWRVLEPVDTTEGVPHEVHRADRIHAGSWMVMAASVRGKLHAHQGTWRDDAFEYGWVDHWTVMAVSDGAGSAPLSRIGARIACHEGIKVAKKLLAGYRFQEGAGEIPEDADLHRMRCFLSETARKARTGILREAQLRGCAPRDLNATFLLAVHGPYKGRDFVGAIQVGDGAIGVYLKDETCVVLGKGDHGEFSSETRFLTTPGIENEFDQRVFMTCKSGMLSVALLCDGVSDDFFPEDKRLRELFVGDPIEILRTQSGEPVYGLHKSVLKNDSSDGSQLLEWLRYEKKQSSDDRTVVLLHRSET